MKSQSHTPGQFDRLVATLQATDLTTFNSIKHVRIESAHHKKQFVVYQHEDDELQVLDVLTVGELTVTAKDGAWTTVTSSKRKSTLMIDYRPTRLWDYRAFMWLPLHFRLRWDMSPDTPVDAGVLSYPVAVRTASRFSLREPEVDYVETLREFHYEFGQRRLSF